MRRRRGCGRGDGSVSFTAVHIPEFPAAVWQRHEPELRLQPLAVIEGAPPQERVVSRNRHAKVAGVRHGMSKVQAEAAGPVHFRPRQIELERATYTLALEIAERFSPRVEAIASPANGYQGSASLAAALLLDSSGDRHPLRLDRELRRQAAGRADRSGPRRRDWSGPEW